MEFLTIKSTKGTFRELLKKAKKEKGTLVLYEGDCIGWYSHPEGVIIQKREKNELLLNGETPIGFYDGCCSVGYEGHLHPEGRVFERGNKLLLNGIKLLYEGECDSYRYSSKGLIIRIGNKFFRNGKLIYEGKGDFWGAHVNGVILREKIEKGLSVFLLNGKKVIYRGSCFSTQEHLYGILINAAHKLFLNEKLMFTFGGKNCSWSPHPAGVLIRNGDNIFLNGKKLLHEGRFDSYCSHLYGVVIKKDNRLILKMS